MGSLSEMTRSGLLSVATGMLLTVAAFVAQAQEPIALRCQPGGKGVKFVRGISFSPDGRWLAAGMYDKVVLWDISTRQIVAELPVAKGAVSCLAFSPDGHTLAAGQTVGAIRIWDGSRGWTDASEAALIQAPVIERQKPGNLPEEREQVSQVGFCGDGEVLAWSSGAPTGDYRVHFWKWSTREELSVLPIGRVQGDQRFQLNGNELAVVVGGDRRPRSEAEIQVWDTAASKRVHRVPVPAGPIGGVRFSPDGKLLAGTLYPGFGRQASPAELFLWDVATGKSVSFGRGPHRWLSVPAFSPDGRTLAVGTFSNPPPPCPSTVLLFDVATGRRREVFRSPQPGTAPWELAFSPDGQYLAAGMEFDEVPVYLCRLSPNASIKSTSISPRSSPE